MVDSAVESRDDYMKSTLFPVYDAILYERERVIDFLCCGKEICFHDRVYPATRRDELNYTAYAVVIRKQNNRISHTN